MAFSCKAQKQGGGGGGLALATASGHESPRHQLDAADSKKMNNGGSHKEIKAREKRKITPLQ